MDRHEDFMGPNCLGTVGAKRGGLHPVIRDRHITTKGKRERGGTKTVGIPEYVLTIKNVPEPPSPPPPPPPPPTPPSAPGVAVLDYPPSGATGIFTDGLVLAWSDGGNTTSFSVWINGVYYGRVFGTQFSPTGLDTSTRYSWRVDSIGPGGVTEGVTQEFITAANPHPMPPEKVVNLAPSNGDTSVPGALVVLSWVDGGLALSYDVYVNGVFQGNQFGTSFSLGALPPATTVTWRVDAVNHDGTTLGDTWSFTTSATVLPSKATTPSPANSATGVAFSGSSLTWVSGANTTSFDVWFNGVFQGNQAGTSFSLPLLSGLTVYTWRIDAVNGDGTTTGDTWSFTTANYNSLVVSWASRVVTNGGAAPSSATKAALSSFCDSLDSNSLTALMYSVNCFIPDSLIASITPLVKTLGNDPWTNHGPFLAGDLSVSGLKGNGTTKYLDTGVKPSNIEATYANQGVTLYFTSAENSASYQDFGSNDNSPSYDTHQTILELNSGGIYWDSPYAAGSGRMSVAVAPGTGYYSANRTAANINNLYFANSGTAHGPIVATNTFNAGALATSTAAMYCFAFNAAGSASGFSAHRISFSAVHKGLTQAQSLAFFNAIQALRTALGGGFV